MKLLPTSRQRVQLELIHDQLPLAVPCYDLVLVIEFTVVRREDDLRALPTPLTWRAVSTRLGNVFTVTCWFTITSDSNFMWASCSPQSELRNTLSGFAPHCCIASLCISHCITSAAQGIKGHADLASSSPSSPVREQSRLTLVTGNEGCVRFPT